MNKDICKTCERYISPVGYCDYNAKKDVKVCELRLFEIRIDYQHLKKNQYRCTHGASAAIPYNFKKAVRDEAKKKALEEAAIDCVHFNIPDSCPFILEHTIS